MTTGSYNHIFFLGIGGIGVSALARYFHAKGKLVAGYDKTDSPLINKLREEGIEVTLDDNWSHLPSDFRDIEKTLIVYTPAVPKNTNLFKYFAENKFEMRKRSQVLGEIVNAGEGIAVAGTHGKTTTSSMAAHLLHHAGINASAFLGGIANNFGSNLVIGRAKQVVVEADEYDRSFMWLHPKHTAITSMDPDHMDIYGSPEQMVATYNDFARQASQSGTVIHRHGLPLEGPSYGVEVDADYTAQNVRVEDGWFVFDLKFPHMTIQGVKAGLPGRHNVENAVAAAALAYLAGSRAKDIASGIETFKGVKRRFDFVLREDNRVVIDDYAHHPEELRAIIGSARELFPDRKLTVMFQPHLFSRTKDFLVEFAKVLSEVDELRLLEIYPAREEPIPGITSSTLLKKCTIEGGKVLSREEAVDEICALDPELLLILGAGDIDRLVEPIVNALQS
ncbi:UDP-N-acetylmuramate--L-alanine ligase [Phaeocystidibacter luteus]|uniref:UDP-N-acetylmuramate--L-alanine ligase n=1 Tax=Phaeocystidibacter luteus TaxID=911197 RepID=A0A6N6RH08_9FLAO|nr:UDP-N-acetylmuramate--L-alanine ligase [Phaeocystidibacter luteus]KAB2813656.1 UDP-N-acetylmuramate--L-alanine ligase [Phaeocystidibacter luteus]